VEGNKEKKPRPRPDSFVCRERVGVSVGLGHSKEKVSFKVTSPRPESAWNRMVFKIS